MKSNSKKAISAMIAIIIILIILSAYFFYFKPNTIYSYNTDSFSYSKNRGTPKFNIRLHSENETLKIFKVNFPTRSLQDEQTKIYGLLVVPKTATEKNKVPGLVLLPAGSMTKEGQLRLASIIAEQGIAVLTIDQRGVGQTGGSYLGYKQDFEILKKGNEPMQHLAVYDALRTFDVLREIPEIDKNNIAIAGESMGARYAIIAAALDNRFKGLIAISGSGFYIRRDMTISLKYNNYLSSIDPDHYIDKISPRPVYMIHSENDNVVTLSDAQRTFGLAKEPKEFNTVNDEACIHGYCDVMYDHLVEGLEGVFG